MLVFASELKYPLVRQNILTKHQRYALFSSEKSGSRWLIWIKAYHVNQGLNPKLIALCLLFWPTMWLFHVFMRSSHETSNIYLLCKTFRLFGKRRWTKSMRTAGLFFRNNLLPVGKRELVAVFNKNLNKTIALLTHTDTWKSHVSMDNSAL